jgi:predicted membrane protein
MEHKRLFYLSGQTIMGAAAVLIGTFLLLDNFDVLDARLYLRFWPLILVVFGAVRIMNSSHTGGRFVGVVIALIGAILLIRELGFTDIGFHELWPLVFVLLGVSMLLGRTARGKILGDTSAAPDSHSIVNAFAVLGGVQQSNNSQDFRGGELSAIMGGCEIDLRQASIGGEEAVISTFAMWGGIKIKVPPAWNVIVQGVPFLGGFDDKSVKPTDPSAKRLIVKGTAIMGGVEVTN